MWAGPTQKIPTGQYPSDLTMAERLLQSTRLSSASLFFRLSKLLVRLPALRLISAAVTEELFFAGLIGNVQIDSIIPYILKMETTDYNSQTDSGVWRTSCFLFRLLSCEDDGITKWSRHSVFMIQDPAGIFCFHGFWLHIQSRSQERQSRGLFRNKP